MPHLQQYENQIPRNRYIEICARPLDESFKASLGELSAPFLEGASSPGTAKPAL